MAYNDPLDPRYPQGQQGPSVSTTLPEPPAALHPAADMQVRPPMQRPGAYGPAAAAAPADPRYPQGQQGPSVSTQVQPAATTPWYQQPHARVVPPVGPQPQFGRTWAPDAPAAAAPGEKPAPGPVRAVMSGEAPQAEGAPAPQAGGGAVFGMFPQLAGGRRTSYATDAALRTGVVATGPSSFAPAPPIQRSVQQGLPSGVQPSTAGAGRGTVNPPMALAAGQPGTAVVDLMPAGGAAAPAPQPQPQPAPAPAAVAGTPVAGAPGAFRFVDPSGRVLYTDQASQPAGTATMGAAPSGGATPAPSGGAANVMPAANMAATSPSTDAALSAAQMAAVQRGEPLGPSAAALPALAGAVIPGVNAPASQAVSELEARNYGVDKSQLLAQASRSGGRVGAAITGLVQANDQSRAQAADSRMREASATERANIQDAGQTKREGMRQAAEGPLRAAQTGEAQARTGETQAKVRAAALREKLVAAHQAAVDSGDAKAAQRAEDKLRAHDAKYEKSVPETFKAIAVPGGVDPATGLPTGSTAVVYNTATGEVANRTAPGAQAAPPKLPPKDQLKAGQVYDTPRGKAKWDGSKFTPV